VFGQCLAAAHHVVAGVAHTGPVPFGHVLIGPPFDLAPRAFAGQAARPQRTLPANRATAGVADRHLAAGLTLFAAHRPQLDAGRTAIGHRRRRRSGSPRGWKNRREFLYSALGRFRSPISLADALQPVEFGSAFFEPLPPAAAIAPPHRDCATASR
jgi:hypothetical protein